MNKRARQKIKPHTLQKELKGVWHHFNRTKFQGSLPRCPKFVLAENWAGKLNLTTMAAYSFEIKGKKIINGTIILSEKLFYHAPTRLLKEAILHEMAHQFCTEVLWMPNEGHGKIWKFVCQGVGINPRKDCLWRE